MHATARPGVWNLKRAVARSVRLLVLVSLTACGGGSGDAGSSGGSAGGSGVCGTIVTNGMSGSATPAGSVTGNPVVQTIGPNGGNMVAPDGGMALSIPAGALAMAVDVSIQPITATAPGALSTAYRLSPANLVFLQPVQLALHYTSADLVGTVPDALGVAVQDVQGYWHVKQTVVYDVTANTLNISTTSFAVRPTCMAVTTDAPQADVSLYAVARLAPTGATLAANDSLPVTLDFCDVSPPIAGWPAEDARELEACGAPAAGALTGGWSVIGPGTLNDGTSSDTGSTTYQAPATWPTDQVGCTTDDGAWDACVTRGLLVRSTVPVTVSIGVSAPCAVGYLIGGKCVAKWVGSSSTTLPGGIPIEGKLVTWVPDGHSHPSGVLGYVAATGTIKVESWTDGVGCFHTYLDDSYTLSGTNDPNGTGTLLVNTNVVPPTYRGSVVTQWFGQTTSSCPDGSSGTADTIIGGAWFSGSGSLNANNASFGATDFTDPTLLQSFTYGFSSR